MGQAEIWQAIEALYQTSAVRGREYYPDFRRGWDPLLKKALENAAIYTPQSPAGVYTVSHSYGGLNLELHFDQLKMYDWFVKELNRRSQAIFTPKKLKRNRAGVLSFHDSVCHYEPEAAEPELTDKMKNIIACALPGIPPELQIVYGNKWVNSKFSVLKQSSLSLFLLNTDYVPAFLGNSLEVCLYLFCMDICIVTENYTKVKDPELRKYLHIFRPSPMLAIKGLLRP